MSFWRELRVRVRGTLHAKVHRAAEDAGMPVPVWLRRTLVAAVREPAYDLDATEDEKIKVLTTRVHHLESIADGLREQIRDLEPLARLGRVVLREARAVGPGQSVDSPLTGR